MSKEKSDTKTSLQSLQEMKKTRFPLSRIKKIIQEDEDVGKTSSTVPVALSKVCEVFIEEVATRVKTGKKVSKKVSKKDVVDVLKEYTIFNGVDFSKV